MKPLAPILAALALSACMTAPELATRADTDKPDRASAQPINAFEPPLRAARPGLPVEVDGAWGNARLAHDLAQHLNQRGVCLAIRPGGTVISAGVVLARQTRCHAPVDRNAPIYGLHLYSDRSAWTPENLAALYGPAGFRAPGCLDWYRAQPEAEDNRIVYVSWNMLERECRP